MNPDLVAEYFRTARLRHEIYLKKARGDPWPWSRDPIFNSFKFTNVYRELDKVTVWFRENIRELMRDDPNVLLATVLFRWFNAIKTGEAVFQQTCLNGRTAWEAYRDDNDLDAVQGAIMAYCGAGPYISPAYMIKSPDGMTKVPGILWAFNNFARHSEWRKMADQSMAGKITLERFVQWLSAYPYQGKFTAYEVASDLRHTCVLERARDVMTWANPGPGAQRGYNRLVGLKDHKIKYTKPNKRAVLEAMRELLGLSQQSEYWLKGDQYPDWEMREVEHWMCEFDKYQRVVNEEGYPKANYTPLGMRKKR